MIELRPVTKENIDVPVGFIMMAYYEAKQYYTLWRFLIGRRYQNRGFGRETLIQGTAFLKDRFDADAIYTGVVPENKTAKHLYSPVGFEYTGMTEFGMEKMCLSCGRRAQ